MGREFKEFKQLFQVCRETYRIRKQREKTENPGNLIKEKR